MATEVRRLLALLHDPDLQAIALAKMEGYSIRQIADQLECSVRTVERRLDWIREEWKPEVLG